jgi:glycine/D-amino acid oxidase-like deaminating enzyme
MIGDGVSRHPLWLDSAARPTPRGGLEADLTVDLAIVGGGFTGLWAALLASSADGPGGAGSPSPSIVVLEAETVGWAASGRNGGFCSASLTHGLDNGLARWPEEMPQLLRLGDENLDELEADLDRHGIDCDFRRAGELTVAVAPWQLESLREAHEAAQALGRKTTLLSAAESREIADSPTYLGGLRDPRGTAVLDPARLAWGLAAAVERQGVCLFEGSRVTRMRDEGSFVRLEVMAGGRRQVVRARRVVSATNAFPSPLRRLRPFTVPVWDHVLATEPLSDQQWSALGWSSDVGISDAGNQFHYYRTTPDRRVVWGGYDALYYFGSDLSERRSRRPDTENVLASHFLATFPQLEGVRFSHAWAGAIDTSTRFTSFWKRALGGKVVAVQGYTGLGVGASRFGAQVALDLVGGRSTERTGLGMVRRGPVPFPPEPLRWAGITLTRRSLGRADAREGHRDLWLRTLDGLGLGFDS